MAVTDFIPTLSGGWDATTPELVVLLFALMAPLVGIKNPDRSGMQRFAAAGLAGAFLITLGSVFRISFTVPGLNIPFSTDYIGAQIGEVYTITYASQVLKLLFVAVALIAVIGVGRPLKGRTEEDWGEFFGLVLFATLGMMVVASSQDLFLMFLGIEMASMSSYLLAGFRRDQQGAEASLKYFVIGSISSGATLFAISLLFGMSGSTNLTIIRETLVTGGGFDAVSIIAIVLMLVGLGFKISSVPFHAWAPDVYSGSPVPLAAMLASASKAMGFAAIFQIFLVGLIGVKSNWELAVAIIAVLSMFFGNLVAIQQTSIRRMLAYSSIAQAGYLLIAVVVGTVWAVQGGIIHLWMNAAMKLGAFIVVGALLSIGIPDHINSWKGLGKRAPFLAFAMLIFLLSMAGLPPLGGFWSKFILFSSAVDQAIIRDLGWMMWLAVFAVLNSAISLFYYLRVIRTMYVSEGDDDDKPLRIGRGATIAVGVCMLMLIISGLAPAWFVDMSFEAAESLLPVLG